MRYEDMDVFVTAPRGAANDPRGPRALAITNATAAQQIDNDILQAVDQTGAKVIATSGYVLVRFHAEGCDMYIRFGLSNAVVADPAAVGALVSVADFIPQGTYLDYMLNPQTDKFFSCRSIGAATGTLRYRQSCPPTNLKP
jgi:hypothetical protein